ncbi:MAG: HAD hydrolase family protein [Chloroflexota bacterium]|nr:HAD hydrolase family protein [Chloroflexota bacterium]
MKVKRERILIVEDSLGVARALNQAFSLPQGGGYQVEVSESGEAALERLRDAPFDLLISDLRLPGMDGLELLDHARQIRPKTRSVLITAFGSPQIEERAHHLADAYLPKPFRLHEIIRIVRRILSEPVEPKRSRLAAGDEHLEVIDITGVERGHLTHLTVLACGLEGTLTDSESGHIATETWEMLRQAKTAGLSIILVTGRTWDSLAAEEPYTELCEAIVAEDGAVVYFPRREIVALPFGRLAPAVMGRLEALGIPLMRGAAILATSVPHDEAIMEVLRETRGGATVEYNRGAVMVLPPGATKGTGLHYALRELGYSPHNVVACGDAENDRSLFEMAELAVAVSNALPDIQALADVVLPQASGAGVQTLVTDLLSGRVPSHQSRPDRRLFLGRRMDGTPVHLDPLVLVNSNLGIFGGSGSGKSWLAGLLAEELLKHGYQVCIIDPEGDYRALGAGPHTLLLGGLEKHLPPVADVINFFECGCASLVLDLSVYAVRERSAYVLGLLRALHGLRARRSRPHWFLVDEVQNLCPPRGGELTDLLLEIMQGGSFGLVSYRPSQVAPALLQAMEHWMLTRLHLTEDIETLGPFLGKHAGGAAALAQLPTLPVGQAYLSFSDAKQPPVSTKGFVQFHVGARTIPHVRHLRKYLQAPLPGPKRFYFHDISGRYLGRTAANLCEFREALSDLSIGSLQYHLQRGDFESWLQDVLHDDELAHRVHKLSRRELEGQAMRQALLEVVINRYEELDSLT